MSKSVVITARISDPLSAELDRLAGLRERSRAWLVEKAVAAFVREELAMRDALNAADGEIERGGGQSHESFMAQLKAEFGTRHAA